MLKTKSYYILHSRFVAIFLHAKWQQHWKNKIYYKLFQIKPILEEWGPAFRKLRCEQVSISWLRIGYTTLTDSFMLKEEKQTQVFDISNAIHHLMCLIECRDFALIRKRFFKVNSMSNLFKNINMDDVLSFLRDVGLH